jgi:hypothetical protein
LRGKKVFTLVLFLCVSFAIMGIGVKNLFAVWVPCTEVPEPKCHDDLTGCWAYAEYSVMGCLIFDCLTLPNPYDCTPPW